MIELPNLDDRTYADFIAAARARIPSLAPDWTDHNPADPGIVLIELFAWLSEIVMYRINRVPQESYRTFLRLLSATPATDAELDTAIRKTLTDLRERFRAVTTDDYEYLALHVWPTLDYVAAMGVPGVLRRARAIAEQTPTTLGSMWTDPQPKAGEGQVTLVVVADSLAESESDLPAFASDRQFAVELDGTAAIIDCGNDPSLAIVGPLTLSAWIFPRNLARGRQGILCKQAIGELELYVEPDGTIGFRHADGNDGGQSTIKVPNARWSHVAVVRSADGHSLAFYVNGAPAGSVALAKTPAATTAHLVLGRLSSGTGFFDGFIRDACIWNVARGPVDVGSDLRKRPLSADEAASMHPQPATPVACYWLDTIAVRANPQNATSPLVTPDAETKALATTRPRDGVVSSSVTWRDVRRPLAVPAAILAPPPPPPAPPSPPNMFTFFDERRLLTTGVHLIDHRPLPVTVTASIYLKADGVTSDVQRAVIDALARTLDPLRGWQGQGWPFDRPIYNSDLSASLESVPGVDFVDGMTVTLSSAADQSAADTGDRKPNPTDENGLDIGVSLQPDELPFLSMTTLTFLRHVGTKWLPA